MQKFGDFICKHKVGVLIVSVVLMVLSFIGMELTKVNYDILVYLPQEIETIKGQNVLTDDFDMGAYAISIIDNMSSKDILKLEESLESVEGVNKVVSLYDVIGTTIPVDMLPNKVTSKLHHDNTDLLFITFADSTSSETTIDAVKEIRDITKDYVKTGGMSSLVLDTMELSNKEIAIYIVIAVLLCILVLELSLDSYVVPFILLTNIGCAILFNLGTNIFLGQISYITKALVAVLQLGVTTDFSIFLYHSFEKKKNEYSDRSKAMVEAIKETFTSVTGSSLTTIAGFLVLCTMQLTLGADLGIVMAKGVLIGVICVLTLFPSLLLVFDKFVEKTKHKIIIPKFEKLNRFVVNHYKPIFVIFLVLLIPAYLANSKIDVYYKMDKTLPASLESITANERIKDEFGIASPEIILLNKDIKNDEVLELSEELEEVEGVDFVLSFAKIKDTGITEEFMSEELVNVFENDKYQMLLLNSEYDVATDELNDQISVINDIVKKYDQNAIVAGEGPLMKDLITTSDTDFKNVNYSSVACIFVILFIVLKSFSLPFLLIATIEFAIFMNMGTSYFTGTVLPFVAPIVLGTIQLGATIDYAILMTTTYIGKRNSGMKKEDAMFETLNYCGSSILVSGMCFFAATFGVGLYSELEMVGSLCTLISRGALISMAVVILILPSILLVFDKLILKTSFNKGDKENMKKEIKKVSAAALTGIALLSFPFSVDALTKNETVYAKLNSDGSVKTTIVNEELVNDNESSTIDDYSNLVDILNVNGDSKYNINNKKLVWQANGSDILYQGSTSEKLPIGVSVTYKLDGKETNVNDMIGKSGKVTINLKYSNREAHNVYINGRYETMYTPFIAVTGTLVDNKNNSNVSVNNGKVVNKGTKEIVVGVATPGIYESLKLSEFKNMDNITISFDTTKFELPSIYTIITPKLIEGNDLNIFNKLDPLYDKVNILQDSMNEIAAGSNKLASGTGELKTKLGEAINNVKTNNSDALSAEQVDGIKSSAVNSVKSELTDEYKTGVASATWATVEQQLDNEDEEAVKLVTEAVTEAVLEYLNDASLTNDYVNCETGKAYVAQGAQMTQEQMVSCGKIQASNILMVQKYATTAASKSAQKITPYVAEKISKQVAVNVMEQTALKTAGDVAEKLAPQVANQVKSAALTNMGESLVTLYNGVSELDNGMVLLNNGITEFNKEGITKISELVNGDVKTSQERIESLVKLSNDYQTFAGKSNGTKGTTKFIMVIDGVNAPKKETKKVETQKKLSLWERFLNLFR